MASSHTLRRGATLVELVVVLVLIGILAGLAMPRLMDSQARDEAAVRDELRSMLRYARQHATTRGRDVCLVRQGTLLRLTYTAGAACDLTQPVPDPGGNAPGGVASYELSLPPRVVVGGPGTVRFNRWGQPVSNNGAAVLAANRILTVGGQILITVHQDTGYVS